MSDGIPTKALERDFDAIRQGAAELCEEDWEHFMEVMTSPREPTPTMRAGIELHRKLTKR